MMQNSKNLSVNRKLLVKGLFARQKNWMQTRGSVKCYSTEGTILAVHTDNDLLQVG